MNRDEIKKIIPHREPMLLIDEVILTEDNKALGKYTVRGDEFFLSGHFPQNPVVPGVILCEIMAQACCILFAEVAKDTTPYYTGLNNVKFRNKVVPGDTLQIECSIIKSRPPFYFATGKGSVNGKICFSGDFSFALIK